MTAEETERNKRNNCDTEQEEITSSTSSSANFSQVIQNSSTTPLHSACHCEIYERLLKETLVIKEATTGYLDPITGQDSGNFVTYVIELGEGKTRRRYSDFELLSAHLNRLYTYQVIPPIPEKETITSIISGYTGLKDRHDPFLIQHRIRLFQSFLVNLQRNPILRGDHYFHRLVDVNLNGATWSEGIASISEGQSSSSSSNSGNNATEQHVSSKGKVPDPLVARLEEMTQKYREGIRSIERGQSKLLKRLKDESNVLGELGASFNAFSLELTNQDDNPTNEDDNISTNENEIRDQDRTNKISPIKISTNQISFKSQLDMIGQSSDSEVIHLHSLIRHHELLRDRLQEIILYCGRILKSLNNLTQKRASLEDFHDEINGKKNALMQMESNMRAGEEGDEKLQKLKKTIIELENSKKLKLSEMSEYSNLLLKDIDRTFSYFGRTWKESLKALAGCQSEWHEEAIKSWKIQQ